MMIPVRCFTCGKVIANVWETYRTRILAGEPPAEVLNDIGVTRVCCRRMFVAHPYNLETDSEPIDETIKYN